MTYSRPSTRAVDALQSVGTPNSIEVKGDSNVQVSANGRVVDARDPNQLIRNQEAKTAVMTNFIDKVTDAGTKLYKGYLEDQANDQIGNLLANTSPEDLMAVTADGPQRDAIRNLNPFAQDKLNEFKAQYGFSRYGEVLLSENEKNRPLLTDPSTSDEQKTQIRNDIRETARQESGLANLPANVLSLVAKDAAELEGRVSGRNYGDTLKRQKERDLQTLENGLLSTIAPFVNGSEGPDGRGNIEGAQQALERQIADNRDMFTPKDNADRLYSGVETRVAMLIANGNADEAVTLTNRMVDLAGTSIKTPSGQYFFDIKDDNGKSLTLKLSDLANNALRQQEIQGRRDVKELMGNYVVEYGEQTSPEGKSVVTQNFRGEIATLPPSQRAEAIAAMGQVGRDLDRPTQLQIKNSAEIMIDISRKGLNEEDARARLLKEVDLGRITATQYGQRLTEVANGNPDRDLYNDIGTAEKRYENETITAVQTLIEVGSIAPNGDGTATLDGYNDKEKQTVVLTDLRKRVIVDLEKQAKEARDSGKPWTTQMMVDAYEDALARQAQVLRDEYSKGQIVGESKTQLQRINEEYTGLIENAKTGPITVDSFLPETIKRWKKRNNGKTPTVKDLLGELTRQLKPLKDDKGNPIYEDPAKELKDLLRLNRQNNEEPIQKSKYQGGGFNPLNWLPNLYNFEEPDKPKSEGEDKSEKPGKKDDQANAAPVDGFKDLLSQGLGALSNVIERPAVAGTLEGKPGIINTDNTSEFAKVMARQVPLGIKTQALPQISAASEVRRAPIAISNRNHPFFVAIGIAEGTRTPSGGNTKAYYGHTDPGDGNRNRGTVSGGRNGGTPQQVDRQWMGILTSVSATMAPLLQRLGLPPNSQGWNRVMFNVLDLRVQAPAAVQTFISKLPQVMNQGLTIEAIAKARADSFINPQTGRLEASGFSNNYSRLFADQRSRAGVYDYKRRF